MAISFKNTIYMMLFDYNMESDLCEEVYKRTDRPCEELLSMIQQNNRSRAEELIDDIAFQNKSSFYQAGFRRAMNIMLDSLCSE